ncbi:MAG: hypothetical protein BIFFINMI_04135 [Phycisphaerae bacterium]|nr:hypothetical protein [Phycisphaerae bacterium]
MVIVAILSLLVSVLLPALGRAREEARRIKCLSNLRQMAIIAHEYVERNNGSFPPAYWEISTDASTKVRYEWDYKTTIAKGTGKVVSVEPGLLWEGLDVSSMQQCPSFAGVSNSLADPFTGYNYNISFIGHGQNETVKSPARLEDVMSPDHCALFGDGEYRSGANKFMRSPMPWSGDKFQNRSAGTQGFRHNGMTNVVFVDGHAASLSKRCTHTWSTAEEAQIAPACGFLDEDNSLYDLK